MDRILFVNLEGAIGGAETSLILLVQLLRPRFELAVACPGLSPLAKRLTSDAIRVYDLPEPPSSSHLSPLWCPYWVETARRLVKLVRAVHPDLIHANNLWAGVISVPVTLATNTRLVLHVRDLANLGLLSRLCSWFCQKVIAVSHAVREDLVRSGVRPDKITVLHNAVDHGWVESLAGRTCQEPCRPRKNPFTFAHVGQFVPWKNHFLFLDAAACVAREVPDCRFTLVGDDVFHRDSRYRRDVLRHVARSPISERITVAGWQEDMTRIWPHIDCLVHTAEREPFGRVIIEAMAYGIPVVAVNRGGPADIIRTGVNGILVARGNVREISLAMLGIARDGRLARSLGTAGRENVRAHFTTAQMMPRLLDVYQEVLSG